ncbi:MAG TPA: hypothetical protein VKT30_17470 [Caulobacteraceae bacterium]|nr:hypothetical protein [Caulobacteraceae bacterium]
MRPPISWSPTAKARFSTLDPAIQQEVLRREQDIESGQAQWRQQGERLNRLDAVIAPHMDRIRLQGLDEARAIEALFTAQTMLERDPVNALGYLARQYGVNPASLGRVPKRPADAPVHSALQQLTRQVRALQGTLAAQQQTADAAEAGRREAEIAAFRADPAHPHLDDVAADMAALLRSGRAATLKDAYDKAVWANPEIRALLLSQQESERRAADEAARRAKAAAARHAAGSITGAPQPGSSPAGAGPAPTLRDELSRAFSHAS